MVIDTVATPVTTGRRSFVQARAHDRRDAERRRRARAVLEVDDRLDEAAGLMFGTRETTLCEWLASACDPGDVAAPASTTWRFLKYARSPSARARARAPAHARLNLEHARLAAAQVGERLAAAQEALVEFHPRDSAPRRRRRVAVALVLPRSAGSGRSGASPCSRSRPPPPAPPAACSRTAAGSPRRRAPLQSAPACAQTTSRTSAPPRPRRGAARRGRSAAGRCAARRGRGARAGSSGRTPGSPPPGERLS